MAGLSNSHRYGAYGALRPGHSVTFTLKTRYRQLMYFADEVLEKMITGRNRGNAKPGYVPVGTEPRSRVLDEELNRSQQEVADSRMISRQG